MQITFQGIPEPLVVQLNALLEPLERLSAKIETADAAALWFEGVPVNHTVDPPPPPPICAEQQPIAGLRIAVLLADEIDVGTLMMAGYTDYIRASWDLEELRARLEVLHCQARQFATSEAIRRRLERFELASRGSQVGLWYAEWRSDRMESPDNYTWYSDHFRNLVGVTEEDFPNITGSWDRILHPDDRPRVWDALRELILSGKHYHIAYRLKVGSGEYRWFEARGEAVFDETGTLLNIAGNVRDIHDEKRTADQLAASEAKYRTLIETAPDMILEVDRDSTVRFINRVDPDNTIEQVIGTKLTSYATEEDGKAFLERLESVYVTGKPARFESLGFGPHGHIAWYASRLGPIREHGDHGDVVAVTVIVTDITPRKEAEFALRNEQKLLRQLLDIHEKDRQLFAYEIHDGLAQQIAGALMHLESFSHAWTLDKHTSPVDLEQGISLVRNSVKEARRLIGGLRPPILDEQGIVAALEYLAHEARQYIPEVECLARLDVERLTPPLEASIFRIAQEAIQNAVHHAHTDRLRIELQQLGGHVRLHVRDWGIGFDMEGVREERFGLQGIRQRARLMGSHAEIDSAPGKGASITVDFSAIEPATPETIPTALNKIMK